MQKKRLLLIIGGLAAATFVLVTLLRSSLFFGALSTLMPMMDGGKYSEDISVPAGYGGGDFGMAMPAPRVMDSRTIYPPYYGNDNALDVENRVYMQSSDHQVVVNDVSEYLKATRDYITSVEGQVLSFNVNTSSEFTSGHMQAKVPVNRFDEASSKVTEGVKEVIGENYNSQDVTGQVVSRQDRVQELQDQIEEKQAELSALTEGTTAYVRVQNQIDNLRRQLSQAEQAQEQIDEQVEYSTISVTAASNERYFNRGLRPDPWTEFQNAIDSLGGSLMALAYVAIWIGVYAVIWLPIVLVVLWVRRRFRKA